MGNFLSKIRAFLWTKRGLGDLKSLFFLTRTILSQEWRQQEFIIKICLIFSKREGIIVVWLILIEWLSFSSPEMNLSLTENSEVINLQRLIGRIAKQSVSFLKRK